jgi:protein O-mannosyl-transferase
LSGIQSAQTQFSSRRPLGDITIALLAFAASITSVANGFAFDDRPLIELNPSVHSLKHALALFTGSYWPANAHAGLYRPLTSVSFAIQWAIGGGTPLVFHIVSILLYAVCCVLAWRLIRQLTSSTAAWIAAAVFAVHPVHVEAVGNVVGQAELLAAVAVLGALLIYVRDASANRTTIGGVALLAALYAAGMLSKESAVVLPALLIIVDIHQWPRTRSGERRGSLGAHVRAVRPMYLVLIAVGLAVVWARMAVLGDTDVAPNTALANLSFMQRAATMLGVVPEWLRLFVWPNRLIPVYSPPYIHIATDFDARAALGVTILVAAAGIAVAASRRGHAIALGLEWLAITLLPVSNLVVVTGLLLAERTLFLPSVGFAMVAGTAGQWIYTRASSGRWRPALEFAFAAVIAAALVRSAVHQRVWANDGRLITAAITAAPNSYQLDAMYADYALQNQNPSAAEQWLKRAIALYPSDPASFVSLGQLYVQTGHFDGALLAFTDAMRLDQWNSDARAGMIVCLDHFGRYSEARILARGGIASGGEDSESFRRLLVITDSLAAKK